MSRILILVEGQTEETFVSEVLADHLMDFGHYATPRILGNARVNKSTGGILGWGASKQDIVNYLVREQDCYVTTMVDFYALPSSGSKAWPGRSDAGTLRYPENARLLHDSIKRDVVDHMTNSFNPNRFIPYVMMYEFEGLLFSDCRAFASAIGQPQLEPEFEAIRQQFGCPEEINDSPVTAPSKRIVSLVRHYQKPFMGVLGILEIGLGRLRHECPIFNDWVARLESLP